MMKENKMVFVTGGSGFVGKYLIPQLIHNGYQVKALARSKKSAHLVRSLGAIPVQGDLENIPDLKDELIGVTNVYHLAASVDFFATKEKLEKLHVGATRDLLHISKIAGVSRFIYLGAASVIMNGQAINNANEDFVSDNLKDGYSQTKLEAEKLILSADGPSFRTVSLRPPLIWGKDDPNTLPSICEAIDKGRMMLINKGAHRFSTCHVKNVCHGLILAGRSDIGGKAYFLTDLETPVFKDFMKRYVAMAGYTLPERSVPLSMAKIFASSMAGVWQLFKLKGQPPLYPGLVNVLGLPFTLDCSNAIEDLGYSVVISIDRGMDS